MNRSKENQWTTQVGAGLVLGIGTGALVKHLLDWDWGIVAGFLLAVVVILIISRVTGKKIKTPMEFAPGKFRNIILMGVVYFASLMLVYFLLTRGVASPWNLVLAAATFLPGTALVYVFLDAIFTLDEMQSRLMTQGITFAFFATLMVVFSLGILELVGIPSIPMIFMPLVMAFFMAIGKLITMRRY